MKNILIALLLMGAVSASAQEGVVHFKRTTYWTKLNNQLTYLSKQEKEKSAYMFGKRDDWAQSAVLYFNAKGSRYTPSDELDEYSFRKEEYNINRDLENGKMTDIIEMLGKTYVIEDTLQTPKWKIMNDLKDVAGHICMKATIDDPVKNQHIIAWFAQDIPLKAGPERLFGLPGMILELDINDGAVIIEATKIEMKKLGKEMDLPKKLKGKKLTEAGYQAMLDKYIKEKMKEEINPYWSIRY